MKTALLLAALCVGVVGCSQGAHDDHSDHDHSAHNHDGESSDHSGHKISEAEAAHGRENLITPLVERFDASACETASPLGMMRKTKPDQSTEIYRALSVDADCLSAITAKMAELGFKESEPGLFTFSDGKGASETVTVTPGDGETKAGIEWETFAP